MPQNITLWSNIERCKVCEAAVGFGNHAVFKQQQWIMMYSNNWAGCVETRRSVKGCYIKLGNSLVTWKVKKQSTVSKSSAEAEYRSMSSTVSELVWIRRLLNELGIAQDRPYVLFCDNKTAIQIASNPIFHQRTKHIEIDCNFVRDKLQLGIIETRYVKSKEQQTCLQRHLDVFNIGILLSSLVWKTFFQMQAWGGVLKLKRMMLHNWRWNECGSIMLCIDWLNVSFVC